MNTKQKVIDCLRKNGYIDQPTKQPIDKLTALYLLFVADEEEAVKLYNEL